MRFVKKIYIVAGTKKNPACGGTILNIFTRELNKKAPDKDEGRTIEANLTTE